MRKNNLREKFWINNAPPRSVQGKKPTPTYPTYTEMVPMRDGVRLYTEIFIPPNMATSEQFIIDFKSSLIKQSGPKNIQHQVTQNTYSPLPVILIRSPYPYSLPSHHDNRPIRRYWEAGYIVVFQMSRGQGQSEGIFRIYKDDIYDGYDCIQWIASQSWCDGNVGMEGSSYLGYVQLLAARAKPAALKCIIPTAFVGSRIRCFPFSSGVPNKGPYMQWHQLVDVNSLADLDYEYGDMRGLDHGKWEEALRHRPLVDAANHLLSGDKLDSWRETITKPLDDKFWASIHFTNSELGQLDIPMFFIDGWYDMTIGPIEFFTQLAKLQPERSDCYLLVGPWSHSQTYNSAQPGHDDGDRVLPESAAIDLVEQRLVFFDRYLKGDTDSLVEEDRVRVFITGAKDSNANKWVNLPTFPPPTMRKKKLFLHSHGDARSFPSDGVLSWHSPGDIVYKDIHKSTDHYSYDPALPTCSLVEHSRDRRDIEIRSDVLTYTSKPLTHPLTILGEITLVLHAASDAPDTDWFAVITEVLPDGQSVSFHYAPPAFRARYRQGFDREVFLRPNKPEEFRIPMGPAGHQISMGNRLRLSIFSSAFPEYDPNTNTGKEAATDVDMRIARQTIFHDALRPSHIVIPVIDF